MPSSHPTYAPILSPDQANPFLYGARQGQEMYGNSLQNELMKIQNQYAEPNAQQALQQAMLQNQARGVDAQYAQPNAEQALQQAILQNKYYGRNMESQISQRAAQANLYNNKPGMPGAQNQLTTANRTANQGILQAIDNTIPIIQQLENMDIPNQVFGQYLNRGGQARYESQMAALTDSLISAFNLPKTNESIHLVQKMTGRQPWEGEGDYKTRLHDLIGDLNSRKKNARNLLGGQEFDDSSDEASSLSNKELLRIWSGE